MKQLDLDNLSLGNADDTAFTKAADLVTEELKVTKDEIVSRTERLEEKPRAVSFIPNAVLFYGIVIGAVYVGYKLLSK